MTPNEYRTAPISYYIEPMGLRTTVDAWMSIGVASFVVIVAIAALRRRGGDDHDAQTETLLSANKGIAAGGYGAAL